MDDYYLNLLSWGKTNNSIAVALNQSVYIWNADNGYIHEILTLESDTGMLIQNVYELVTYFHKLLILTVMSYFKWDDIIFILG